MFKILINNEFSDNRIWLEIVEMKQIQDFFGDRTYFHCLRANGDEFIVWQPDILEIKILQKKK